MYNISGMVVGAGLKLDICHFQQGVKHHYSPVVVSCRSGPQPPVRLGTSDPGQAHPLLGDDQLGVLRGEGDRGPHRGGRGGGRHQPWKYGDCL